MFWKKKEAPALLVGVEPQILHPQPQAAVPVAPAETQMAYGPLAAKLGFEPGELIRAQLLLFFQEHEIRLYDFHDVSKWLVSKSPPSHVWCWRALRDKDEITGEYWGRMPGGNFGPGFYSSRNSECNPYARLVPLHALEKVEKIQDKFGDKVKFFVSDFADPKADPFIMVRPACLLDADARMPDYILIFDAWDEPGFGK